MIQVNIKKEWNNISFPDSSHDYCEKHWESVIEYEVIINKNNYKTSVRLDHVDLTAKNSIICRSFSVRKENNKKMRATYSLLSNNASRLNASIDISDFQLISMQFWFLFIARKRNIPQWHSQSNSYITLRNIVYTASNNTHAHWSYIS